MRILLVSQMYPGPRDPGHGTFVRALEVALRGRGHDIDLAVLRSRRGGKLKYLELARRTRAAPRPDVVYAHFLVPTGLIASQVKAPLVVTAHGQDVRNVGTIPGVAVATRLVVRRAAAVVAVSDYLRRELEAKIPDARGKTSVINSGVDLARFAVTPARDGARPAYVCVGSLSERKNVVRLARAFERLDGGTLTFVGDGPLRPQLEGRRGVRLVGPVTHDEIPHHLSDADVVCQPSLVEPLGQALLEAMACGRNVVATRVGGPPEFVSDEFGILVDPLDEDALADALRRAAALPVPNEAARAAAAAHDVNEQARRVEELLVRAAAGPPA